MYDYWLNMDSDPIVQLTILWFVVLIYLQTGSGDSGTFGAAIAIFSILLLFAIPVTMVIVTVLHLTQNNISN